MALQKKVKWLFTLIVLANLIIVLMVVLGALGPKPPPPMPNPNGYYDFVKAGRMLTGDYGNYSNLNEEKLAALVATNAEALKLFRIGLGRESLAPNDYSSHYMDHLDLQLRSQRALATVLCAEGRLAILQNRTNDAVQSYLDAMNLGQKCSQGGLMLSKLVGIACESMGRWGLKSFTDGVSSQECRKIAGTLEMLDASEPPARDVFDHERDFVRKSYGIGMRMAALLA